MRSTYTIECQNLYGCLKSIDYAFRRATVDEVWLDGALVHRPRRKRLPNGSKELVQMAESIEGKHPPWGQWLVKGHAYFDGSVHQARWIYKFGLPHAESFWATLTFPPLDEFMADGGLEKIKLLEKREKRSCQPCYPKRNDTRPVETDTRIVARPDLVMLSKGAYPNKYVPKTSLEEMYGVLVARRGNARISFGRAWGSKASRGHTAHLKADDVMWMSSSDRERYMTIQDARQCPMGADAFVGGLGLGLVVLYLAHRCRCITIAEINQDVIELVFSRLRDYCAARYPNLELRIYHGDAIQGVQQEPGRYDYVYMDLWPNLNVEHKSLVERSRQASEKAQPQAVIVLWAEERILGKERQWQT